MTFVVRGHLPTGHLPTSKETGENKILQLYIYVPEVIRTYILAKYNSRNRGPYDLHKQLVNRGSNAYIRGITGHLKMYGSKQIIFNYAYLL